MIIMCKWLHYLLESSYCVQIFEDILSSKIQFDCSLFKNLFHYIRTHYFNKRI